MKKKKKERKESTARNTRGNLFFVPTIVLESMTASASEKMKYCREGSSGRDTRKMSSNSSRNICIGGKIVSPLCSASLSCIRVSCIYIFHSGKRGEKKWVKRCRGSILFALFPDDTSKLKRLFNLHDRSEEPMSNFEDDFKTWFWKIEYHSFIHN